MQDPFLDQILPPLVICFSKKYISFNIRSTLTMYIRVRVLIALTYLQVVTGTV